MQYICGALAPYICGTFFTLTPHVDRDRAYGQAKGGLTYVTYFRITSEGQSIDRQIRRMVESMLAMTEKPPSKLFDLQSKRYRSPKNLSVRIPPERRQKLQLIASERHWTISQMVNRMIENFIEEYDKLPKAKQTKFDF